VLTVFALAIVFTSSTPNRLEAQRAASGILVLSNSQWDSVRVEIRVGASTDCSTNSPLDVRTLRRNERWAIVTDDLICWRREQIPGDASASWAPWENARPVANTTRDVTL